MLKEIIIKEIRDSITSPKIIFSFILCSVLIFISLLMGIINYEADQREYDLALIFNKQELENKPSYLALAGSELKINRPPQILGILVNGLVADLGRAYSISTNSDARILESKYNSNPILAIFGGLDLLFIVRLVLSLIALLFTYNSITGEKENGTLKLMLSNSVRMDNIIIGKAISGLACILVSFAIPFISGLIVMMLYPNIRLTGEDILRISLVFMLFILYLAVFVILGLFISAKTKKTSSSFLILLFIWVIIVVAVPKVAVMVAARLRPIPTVNELSLKKDQYRQAQYAEVEKEIEKYRISNPLPIKEEDKKLRKERMIKYVADINLKYQAEYEKYAKELEGAYLRKRHAQNMLAMTLSRISPASALTYASMSLTKTGLDESQRFYDSIVIYWSTYYKWIDGKLQLQGEGQGGPNLSDMPHISFKSELIKDSLKRALPDFVIMIILVIVIFAGAYWSFARYDVR